MGTLAIFKNFLCILNNVKKILIKKNCREFKAMWWCHGILVSSILLCILNAWLPTGGLRAAQALSVHLHSRP